jgi:Putative lipase essential for disintegration of autophagic bodies inside the vacuole
MNASLLEQNCCLPLPFFRKIQTCIQSEDYSNTTTKFAEIVNNLKEILSEHRDYKVYCTGHSLGGALAQLLAFQLAGEGSLEGFKTASPITAITFASPKVGNGGFRKAYQRLEKEGLIRHIQISNAGDIVPVLPSGFGYTQTGININLSQEDMEISYGNVKTMQQNLGYALKHQKGLLD